jgi:hypothetical protein
MPTSFSLLDALAVERFMKLIQAMTRIKIAMMENSRTYPILPPAFAPWPELPYSGQGPGCDSIPKANPKI